jgi:hypothetical protein
LAEEEKKKDVHHPCASCRRRTFHEVLYSHVESEYEYRMDTVHQMLKCRGCHTVSFRRVVRDYESAYPVGEDEDDDWHVPEDITNYPGVLEGHRELDDVWSLPDIVRDIYTQSVQAVKERSNTLAGIGLRATIEAICNDRGVAGKNLEKRIDALGRDGLISQKDVERLHAIRFLGNDAAHEVKRADPKNLLIALRIIEHLLVNIYVLDNEADGRLDTIINTFDQFKMLLEKKLVARSAGDEVPLAKIFGQDMRRFHGYFPNHEKGLIDAIEKSDYTKLAVGKVDNYGGSKEKVQHFVVT